MIFICRGVSGYNDCTCCCLCCLGENQIDNEGLNYPDTKTIDEIDALDEIDDIVKTNETMIPVEHGEYKPKSEGKRLDKRVMSFVWGKSRKLISNQYWNKNEVKTVL